MSKDQHDKYNKNDIIIMQEHYYFRTYYTYIRLHNFAKISKLVYNGMRQKYINELRSLCQTRLSINDVMNYARCVPAETHDPPTYVAHSAVFTNILLLLAQGLSGFGPQRKAAYAVSAYDICGVLVRRQST